MRLNFWSSLLSDPRRVLAWRGPRRYESIGAVRRRRFADALLLAVLLGAGRARAEDGDTTAELEWILESPSDCITRVAFERRVAEEAGHPVFVDAGAATTIAVTLIRVYDPDGWHAAVTAKAADGRVIGTRELTNAGDSCALADKLALIVALMVDPGLGATPARPEPEPERDPVPRRGRERAAPAPVIPVDEGPVYLAPSLQHPKPEPARVELDGLALLDIGVLPHPAAGLDLGAAIRPSWFWTVRVGVTAFAEQDERVGSGRARFRTALATLALCPHDALDGRFWTRVCGEIGVGPFWVETTGLERSSTSVATTGRASLTGQLALHVGGGWYATALAEGAVPVFATRYVVDLPDGGEQPLFQMGVAVALGAGVAVVWQ